jgi:hypothetical protein
MNQNFSDNAMQEILAEWGHRIRPASTTTKAMHKKYGFGKPLRIRQHHDHVRHGCRFSAFDSGLRIKTVAEVCCAV